MVYLSFKLKSVEFGEDSQEFGFVSKDSLALKVRNLKVYWSEEVVIDKVGSFGHISKSVNDIKGIRVDIKWLFKNNNLLFIPLGFKLDPNFTFKASVDKSPEWLCAKGNSYGERGDETWLDFTHYGIDFNLIEHPLSDNTINEVEQLQKLLVRTMGSEGKKKQEELKRICRTIEDNSIYKDYKKKINNQQLIKMQDQLQELETQLANEENKNAILQQQLTQSQTKYSFYEHFFNNHLQVRRNELDELKEKLTDEEREWWDIYWESHQEDKDNTFAQKQLIRARNKLDKKLNDVELAEILSKQKEVVNLENQLENLQVNEQQLQSQIEIPT